MRLYSIDSQNPSEEIIRIATDVIRNDGIICYPTETLYGIGGNALSEDICHKINIHKGRPQEAPFIILILTEWISNWIVDADRFRPIFDRFWPGNLTIIGEPKRTVDLPNWLLSENGGLAVRSASTPFNKALLRSCGFPIVSTSANRSGTPPTDRIDSDDKWLADLCEIAIDAGMLDNIQPSTIADIRRFPASIDILRSGVVSIDEFRKAFPNTRVEI